MRALVRAVRGAPMRSATEGLVLEGAASGDSVGHAVTSRDLNGDGLGDLCARAYGANSSAGGAALIFGNTGAGLGL